ncbi:MAG: hypothetical protein EA366_01615 [Spirulina sp. DLM2.Bin59]|nr:MAG: hypothetical protein EA366_01615 [Spirulina sp. DLM2.Bin59]
MHSSKPQLIDLTRDYPCPCRRPGTLRPIALTEALGCDRCQQIFEVTPSGDQIQQLVTTYPQRPTWRWNGQRWIPQAQDRGDRHFALYGFGLFLGLITFCLLLQSITGLNFWSGIVILLLLIAIPAVMFWLSYRH